MNRLTKCIVYSTLFVNLLLIIRASYKSAMYSIMCPAKYCISEFLINYQGGFVRRGLMGEILYQICHPLGLDPRYLIIPFSIITAALFIFIIIKLFRKEHLCLWILPTSYVIFGADFIRKDFFMMLLVFWILRSVPKLISGQGKPILVILLSLILLNVHEASFFIFYPILFVYILFGVPCKMHKWTKLAVLAAPLAMMAAVSIFKGDRECAETICRSWEFAFPESYSSFTMWNAIGALCWDTARTIIIHVQFNFINGPFVHYAGFIARPLVLLAIIFLMVQIAFVYQRGTAAFNSMTRRFVGFAAFQLLSLVPLFTVLSCDFCRICFYWTVSSFLAYCSLKDVQLHFPCQERLARLFKPFAAWLAHPVKAVYPFVLLVILGVPFCMNTPIDYLSPIFRKAYWHINHISSDIERLGL